MRNHGIFLFMQISIFFLNTAQDIGLAQDFKKLCMVLHG